MSMFKILRNLKGQGITVQYATTFAVIMAVALAMTTYFKRIVQSRYSGANDYAQRHIDDVLKDTSFNLTGNFKSQYEPYYQETQAEREQGGTVIDRGFGGGIGKVHSKEYQGYQTESKIKTKQLSPKNAD